MKVKRSTFSIRSFCYFRNVQFYKARIFTLKWALPHLCKKSFFRSRELKCFERNNFITIELLCLRKSFLKAKQHVISLSENSLESLELHTVLMYARLVFDLEPHQTTVVCIEFCATGFLWTKIDVF